MIESYRPYTSRQFRQKILNMSGQELYAELFATKHEGLDRHYHRGAVTGTMTIDQWIALAHQVANPIDLYQLLMWNFPVAAYHREDERRLNYHAVLLDLRPLWQRRDELPARHRHMIQREFIERGWPLNEECGMDRND